MSKPTKEVPFPDGSLHGGGYDGAIQAWTDGCFRTVQNDGQGRNCSLGQTGENGRSRSFLRIGGTNMDNDFTYVGPQLSDDPAPEYVPGSH